MTSREALWWAIGEHALSVVFVVLTLVLLATVVHRGRPAGSAYAWILAIVLVPYLGIPLYLLFGGRKMASIKRHLDAASFGDAPLGFGAIEWLDDGVVAYETLLAEIEGAKTSIWVMTFVVGDDETGVTLLEAMTRRAQQGVAVYLLIDDLLRRGAPKEQLRQLVASGGHVARSMPLLHLPFRGRVNLRNHRKLALFDGERAIVGGMNLAAEYQGPLPMAGRWRDLAVLVCGGEVPRSLGRLFISDWRTATGQTLKAGQQPRAEAELRPARLVPSGPDCEQDVLYDQLTTAIFRAERRIWIATPYFALDENLMRALQIALRRGLHVMAVVPRHSNHALADWVGAAYLRELAAAGADIRWYDAGMLHAKATLFDDQLAIIGSANFDMRSLFLDFEVSLLFSGEDEIRRLEGWFRDTMRETIAFSPPGGAWRRSVESVARLLAPLI